MQDGQAKRLRRLERGVIFAAMLIALSAMLYGGRGAFQANQAGTQGGERLLALVFTLASFAIVGAVTVAPYVLLLFLGRRIPHDGSAVSFQIAGIVICALASIATVYLYAVALDAVHGATSSTAGLVFVAAPAYLFLANAVLYGALVLVHGRAAGSSRV